MAKASAILARWARRDQDEAACLEAAYVAWLSDEESDSTFVRTATALIPQESVLAKIARARGEGIAVTLRRLQHAAGIL